MLDATRQLQTALKERGYSLTRARLAVFTALQGEEPQTIRELTIKVGSTADRSSLYRAISLFEKLDIVQRLQIGWKYKLELSAAFSYHHHHLSCIDCGLTIAIKEDSGLEKRINAVATAKNFHSTDHLLEIRGRCPKCHKKK